MTKYVESAALQAWIAENEQEMENGGTAPEPIPPEPSGDMMPVGIDGNWVLTFNDEFDGSSIDTSKWVLNWFGQPGQISPPVNRYEICAYDPKNVRLANGCLEMKLEKRSVTDYQGKTWQYVTGFLGTYKKFEQAFGVFETKIWMPGPSDPKVQPYNWPGFWGNGHHDDWPDHGEIDVMENLSGGPIPHYHFGPDDAHNMNWSQRPPWPSEGWNNNWHTLAVKWGPDRASFYYDGEWFGTCNVVDPNPKYWMLQYSTSNDHGGPVNAPQVGKFDYVRIWKAGDNKAYTASK